ncbi:MAG: LLM class flavin-dependent oxidoreductase [Burkholderiales bacterium]|nr:LLM class flavin-dependent oxidoreductase [Burkholderiales bacterium]
MSIEFIGMIQARRLSEIHPPSGPSVQPDYIRDFARAHEAGGFDRVLVGYWSDGPDGFLVASHAAASTERLGILLAHRPGFVAPTLAARKFATFDQLTGGRAAIHVISGGDDADQRRDGDYLGHDERYARTDEYVEILRKIWTARAPVTHEGTYYRFANAASEVTPLQQPYLPIYFGGSSDAAVAVAGRHADVYALWGEPLAFTRDTVAKVRRAAALHGRSIRFSLSTRPILGRTEAEAWDRAHAILDRIHAVRREQGLPPPAATPQAVQSQRLLQAASNAEVHDRCLWMAIAAATGARANTTALVGTPDQVADALLDYHAIGITTFLIRGFDPLEDAIQYGNELLPRVRARVAALQAVA